MTESAAWRIVSRAILFTLAVLIGLWLLGQLTSVVVRVILAVILAAGMKPLVDSLTRLAMAQRELGLLLGEPPSARGYTPSCFQVLANTIERLGNAAVGGITALLTVLVDGGDMDEPISDSVRSLVDGHIVLDRKIAERGFYPAIDVSRKPDASAVTV